MDCNETRLARLTAYVDGELEASQVRDVERLLAQDPQAREFVRIQREAAELLRAACDERDYITLREARPSPAKVPAFRRRAGVMAAIAAVLVAVVMAFSAGYLIGPGHKQSEIADLLDEISNYHGVYARESDHLVEVPASQRAEISSWLGERVQSNLPIPDLETAGFTFAGGRMLVVDGRPVAQLMYTKAGVLPLGICVTKFSGLPNNLQTAKMNGLDLAWWGSQGHAYVIVGEFSKAGAKILAQLVQSSLRG